MSNNSTKKFQGVDPHKDLKDVMPEKEKKREGKKLSRRDFLAAAGVTALGLVARPAWLRAATLPAITRAIPASGERLPVIGLIQVGAQSMADRYTYLPLVGLFLMVVWGAADLLSGRRVAALAAIVAIVALAGDPVDDEVWTVSIGIPVNDDVHVHDFTVTVDGQFKGTTPIELQVDPETARQLSGARGVSDGRVTED